MASHSGGSPASRPGASPRLTGVLLRAKPPPPQPAWPNLAQCLCSDPVLPAPTSILFARPLGPEVGAGVGGGPKGKQLLPSLPASGDHHTPSPEACPGGSLPTLPPSPGMGVGQGRPNMTGAGGDCSGSPPPVPSPTFCSWLVIEAGERGAVGLGFHLIAGFSRCIPSFQSLCSPLATHLLS